MWNREQSSKNRSDDAYNFSFAWSDLPFMWMTHFSIPREEIEVFNCQYLKDNNIINYKGKYMCLCNMRPTVTAV